jgi:parallel beta-helix repeat protein
MDADTIKFNIPISDPNYNATTGVFTITVATALPLVQSLSVVIDGTSQPGNTNPDGPEICIRSTTNLVYGLCFPLSGGVVKGFIINGFQAGVAITKYATYPSGGCVVSDCYLGTNYNATAADSNSYGVAILTELTGNIIRDNIISGNYIAGIAIKNSALNTIIGNKIGVDRTGLIAIPNYNGIALDSSYSNTIGGTVAATRNLISGNKYAGIAINSAVSYNNTIKGNYIGINQNGLVPTDSVPNFFGIALNYAHNNTIGGTTAEERNVISGNRECGIAIMGSGAIQNAIKGNYIGTNILADDTIPNGNGILISGSSLTAIGGSVAGERNIISGNRLAGIALAYSGSRNNTIKGNYIGIGANGNKILSNYTGVYLKSNANSNTIGGSATGERNVISGNIEMGLCIESSDSNTVKGNYIGPDATGLLPLKYPNDSLVQANGLYFNSNAKHNVAGGYNAGDRNVISGNRVYGHDLYGNSSYNATIGNYIGVDATGNTAMPNATGICVDGGSNHNPFINNVLSGNKAYGMFIVTTGSDSNVVAGNCFGTNAAGTAAVPNQSGLLLGGGTKYNIIGGENSADKNIFSGNTFDGILLADTGTMYNQIRGNYIGTDHTGNNPIPNDLGIGISTKSGNNIIDTNLISGNISYGIIVFEHSNYNVITRNKMGVNADATSPITSGNAGIVITVGSCHNNIGGVGLGNVIANHDTAGVVINDPDCRWNRISENRIYNNQILDIDLYPYGVNANDANDADNGANDLMNYPTITSAVNVGPTTQINGTLDFSGPTNVKVEIFKSNNSNFFQHGGAIEYIGSTLVNPDGTWSFSTNLISSADVITATATDTMGNTSEFNAIQSITVGAPTASQSEDFSIYPMPVNNSFTLSYTLDKSSDLIISIYSVDGKKIANLYDQTAMQGENQFTFNVDYLHLKQGMYFVKIVRDQRMEKTLKLIKN